MKKISIIIILLSFVSCAQDGNKYNLSEIHSPEDLSMMIDKMKEDKVEMDTVYYKEIKGQGMHYDGIPVSKMSFFNENGLTIITDSINYSAKNLLEAIEAKKGFGKYEENEYSLENIFYWDDENENLKLEINFVDGKHLAKMGEKDYAKLEIIYPKHYTIPLANIHRKLSNFDLKPEYELQISRQNCTYEVFLDGISLTSVVDETYKDSQEIDLNTFLLSSGEHKISIKANSYANNSEASYLKVYVIKKEDDKEVLVEKKFTFNNTKEHNFEMTIDCKTPFNLKGWKSGKDLRKDSLLKNKVIALYEKVGKSILNKEEQTISDLFYISNFETRQSIYNLSYKNSLAYWESWLETFKNTYKYNVAQNFTIEYSEDGRLIYATPIKKLDMLVVTGKNYSRSFDFYLYQPQNSNELKIIRE